MGAPLIQIVDEDNNPVGSASISDARRDGLYHQIVRTMIEDEEGMLLLQKRALSMHDFPGCWDSASAGHVDAGESYEEAATREIFEEIGLRNVRLREIACEKVEHTVGDEIINRFEKIYKTTINHTEEFSLQTEEVAEVKWFSLSEVKQMIIDFPETTTHGLREIIRRYYS